MPAIDGVLYDKAMTILMNCPSGKAGIVTVPEGVITIADSAFYRCGSILSIELPDSVNSIGDYSFYYCRSLVTLEIPEGMSLIGNYSFTGCESLISVDIPDSVTRLGDSAFSLMPFSSGDIDTERGQFHRERDLPILFIADRIDHTSECHLHRWLSLCVV